VHVRWRPRRTDSSTLSCRCFAPRDLPTLTLVRVGKITWAGMQNPSYAPINAPTCLGCRLLTSRVLATFSLLLRIDDDQAGSMGDRGSGGRESAEPRNIDPLPPSATSSSTAK
jgi:hypothetical protein